VPGSPPSSRAGALTLIEDLLLTGVDADFDFVSIPAGYKHLSLIVQARSDQAATATAVVLRFNGDASAIYDYEQHTGEGATAAAAGSLAQTSLAVGQVAGGNAPAGAAGTLELLIPNYAETTLEKNVSAKGGRREAQAVAADMYVAHVFGNWRSTAAINRVQLLPGAGNFAAGSRATLYGLG